MVQSRPLARTVSSAASRTAFDRLSRVVATAVVDTNTARSMPASSAAATMAGAWPNPSEARLTRTFAPEAAKASSIDAGSSRSPAMAWAPAAVTFSAAAAVRARAVTSCPPATRRGSDVGAEKAAAPGDVHPHPASTVRCRMAR